MLYSMFYKGLFEASPLSGRLGDLHPLVYAHDAIYVSSDDFHKLSVTFSRIVLQVRENRRIFAPSNNNKEFNIIKIYN